MILPVSCVENRSGLCQRSTTILILQAQTLCLSGGQLCILFSTSPTLVKHAQTKGKFCVLNFRLSLLSCRAKSSMIVRSLFLPRMWSCTMCKEITISLMFPGWCISNLVTISTKGLTSVSLGKMLETKKEILPNSWHRIQQAKIWNQGMLPPSLSKKLDVTLEGSSIEYLRT